MDFIHTDVSSLFLRSHFFVQVILFILAIFSVISWGIAINKWRAFKKSEEENRKILNMIKEGIRFRKIHVESKVMQFSPLAAIFSAVFGALEKGSILKNVQYKTETGESKIGKKFNIKMIERIIETEAIKSIDLLEKRVPFLGTCATLSPFLGLTGTVWGVLRSFMNIGIQGSANILVVAPGIAEALITTVVGLVVAIPAVFFHNHFVGKLKSTSIKLEEFATDLIGEFEEGKITEKL
jgi:biopolymer transport protein TolQ